MTLTSAAACNVTACTGPISALLAKIIDCINCTSRAANSAATSSLMCHAYKCTRAQRRTTLLMLAGSSL